MVITNGLYNGLYDDINVCMVITNGLYSYMQICEVKRVLGGQAARGGVPSARPARSKANLN